MAITTIKSPERDDRGVRFTITMPYSMKARMLEYAKKDNRSLSNFINLMIRIGFTEYCKNIPEDLLL